MQLIKRYLSNLFCLFLAYSIGSFDYVQRVKKELLFMTYRMNLVLIAGFERTCFWFRKNKYEELKKPPVCLSSLNNSVIGSNQVNWALKRNIYPKFIKHSPDEKELLYQSSLFSISSNSQRI